MYRVGNMAQIDNFQKAKYIRNGQYIISNEETLWAVFIVRVVDSTMFSPNFVHALAARMAADTALTFTESLKLEEKMEARYDTKLADAKYSDGSQGTTEVLKSSRLTGVRRR